jgi:hypothetical protein
MVAKLAGIYRRRITAASSQEIARYISAAFAHTSITTAEGQELKSKRLAHHSIQIPSSNYCTRGAMH